MLLAFYTSAGIVIHPHEFVSSGSPAPVPAREHCAACQEEPPEPGERKRRIPPRSWAGKTCLEALSLTGGSVSSSSAGEY
eukprot:657693-Hanusia_phi.AAC.8